MATQVTVSITQKDAEGNDLGGTITFRPSQALYDSDGNMVVGTAPVVATLSSGTASIVLYATDDATTQPTNATYTISEDLTGTDGNPIRRTYKAEIPSASATLRYEDITEAIPATQAVVTYATASQIAAFNSHTTATTSVHGIANTALLLDTSSNLSALADVDATVASNGQALVWDGDSWGPAAVSAARSLTLLATYTADQAAELAWSAISQAYTDLLIVGRLRSGRVSTLENLILTFNADTTAANYDRQTLVGTGAAASAAGATGTTRLIADIPAAQSPTGVLSEFSILIPNYTGATFKTANAVGFYWRQRTTTPGSNNLQMVGWASADAITAVSLATSNSSALTDGAAYLYGVS